MQEKSINTEFIIQVRDQSKINLNIWDRGENNKKMLIITHGYGEHQGYYRDFANYFANKGFIVCTYDLRSHGLSEGKRGHVSPFELFLDDFEMIIAFLKKTKGELPLYLFGHSMGGSIVINYLLNRKPKNIVKTIISSPWLKLAFEAPKFKLLLAKIGKALFPNFPIKGELDIYNLSRNIDFKNTFKNDPLTYDLISSAYFFAIRNAGIFALDNASKFDYDLLMSHGDDDRITSIEASKSFCAKVGSKCTFKEWSGGYKHVVFSENDKLDIFNYFHSYLVQK